MRAAAQNAPQREESEVRRGGRAGYASDSADSISGSLSVGRAHHT
jgi:hypothetical protein